MAKDFAVDKVSVVLAILMAFVAVVAVQIVSF